LNGVRFSISPIPAERLYLRYGHAILSSLLTFALFLLFREPTRSGIDPGVPVLLALVPILGCAYVAGPGPALLAIMIDVPAIVCLVLAPTGGLTLRSSREFSLVLSFVLVSGLVSYFATLLRNSFFNLVELNRERESALLSAKAAEAQASSANRAKDRFLSLISHELRSPLNVVGLSVELLRSELSAAKEEVRHELERIESANAQLRQLIGELLDSSSIASGKLRIEKTPVEVFKPVSEAVNQLRPAAQSKGVTLELKVDGNPGIVDADSQRLHQILVNLVTNSIKFTPSGGTVKVAIKPSPDSVELQVCDNGQGISAEELPHIFERFWQSEKTSQPSGLGLGLYIVQTLVEAHGGRITARSEGIGRGASFTVRIPRH